MLSIEGFRWLLRLPFQIVMNFLVVVKNLVHFYRPRNREPFTPRDRKSTRLNSSHVSISYAVFCLKKKKKIKKMTVRRKTKARSITSAFAFMDTYLNTVTALYLWHIDLNSANHSWRFKANVNVSRT